MQSYHFSQKQDLLEVIKLMNVNTKFLLRDNIYSGNSLDINLYDAPVKEISMIQNDYKKLYDQYMLLENTPEYTQKPFTIMSIKETIELFMYTWSKMYNDFLLGNYTIMS